MRELATFIVWVGIVTFIGSVFVSSGLSLYWTSDRTRREDVRGVAAIVIMTIVAAVGHYWLLQRFYEVREPFWLFSSAHHKAFEDKLVQAMRPLLSACVAPCAAGIARALGGRWHHALLAAALATAPTPFGYHELHVFLLACVALLLTSRRARPWWIVLPIVAMTTVWWSGAKGPIGREPLIFCGGAVLMLSIPLLVLLVPGRKSDALRLGRVLSVCLFVSVAPSLSGLTWMKLQREWAHAQSIKSDGCYLRSKPNPNLNGSQRTLKGFGRSN
jgi:hypothetical protein